MAVQRKILSLFLLAGFGMLAQSTAGKLATGTRIEVSEGNQWRRGAIADDPGPPAANVRVRLDPNNDLFVVSRTAIRLAPRPAAIHVGDRVEWYGVSVTSFRYVQATVKGIGTGSMQGYYLMAMDQFPNSPSYTKAENLWTLPETAGLSAAPAVKGPTLGKYRCFAGKIFLGGIELLGDGSYTATRGAAGRYQVASDSIEWQTGWAKDNTFGGKLEGNAMIRLTRAAYCSHE